MQKYGFDDARDVLERASARETAARVAAGALAKVLLAELGAQVLSHVVALGPVRASTERRPKPADLDAVDESPVRCFDPEAEAEMIARDRGGGQGGRLARRCASRCSATASRPGSARTCTGTGASTVASRRR